MREEVCVEFFFGEGEAQEGGYGGDVGVLRGVVVNNGLWMEGYDEGRGGLRLRCGDGLWWMGWLWWALWTGMGMEVNVWIGMKG